MCDTCTDPGLSPTGGCHNSLKPISSGPTITITAATAAAAAAMVSVVPEELRGLSPSIVQPCHFLTLTPIRIPLRTTPFSGRNQNTVWKGHELFPESNLGRQGQLAHKLSVLVTVPCTWAHDVNCWKSDPGEASSWGFVGSAWWRTIRMHVDSMDQGLAVPRGLWYVHVKSQDPLTTHVDTEGPQDLGHLLVCVPHVREQGWLTQDASPDLASDIPLLNCTWLSLALHGIGDSFSGHVENPAHQAGVDKRHNVPRAIGAQGAGPF